jgi:hypothetical protein
VILSEEALTAAVMQGCPVVATAVHRALGAKFGRRAKIETVA